MLILRLHPGRAAPLPTGTVRVADTGFFGLDQLGAAKAALITAARPNTYQVLLDSTLAGRLA